MMDESITLKERPALSGWPMIIAWVAMLIFALHACTRMVGAGDTWVAMACGRHFINHGVDTVEPFSANSHRPGPTQKDIENWPQPAKWIAEKAGLETVKKWHPTGWINQNWLTHVIFYWLTNESPFADAETLSFNTLVYWKFAIYILTVICVYYTARTLRVNPALSAVFACFAMFVGRTFFDIRPAGFSNLMVAVFLLILVLATYRNIWYIWLIVPLAAFWCNLHGGYIYIFIMLVPFVVLNLLSTISKKWFVTIGIRGLCHTVAAGFVAFLASILFNPFHLTNLSHTFAISVSKHAEMWRRVNEWHPAFEWRNPVGTGFPFLVLVIMSITLLVLWLFSRLLKPRFLQAPKNELQAQQGQFTILARVFGCAAAIFTTWVVFVSFSFLDNSFVDFVICAVFVGILLLSIYKRVYFVGLELLLILLVLYLADPRYFKNVAHGFNGRYIYPFLLLPSYVLLHAFVCVFSDTIKIKLKNLVFVIVTAVAALVLMVVLFNPFESDSVWSIKQFWNLERHWRPAYEGRVKFGYTNLFEILYCINMLAIGLWIGMKFILPRLQTMVCKLPDTNSRDSQTDTYQLPRIDLSLIAIAALTIYMAVRSRRFITIAAIAACPVLAMLIDHMVRTISAATNFYRRNRLEVSKMPAGLQRFFTITGAVVVLVLGTWWGLKFKRIYLDPWPSDPVLNSVFMRMTASAAKPFYACQFIKANKLKGKMFNYWTEGGFIAWGQCPDSNTGRTPLQLFMDGRAQAAYEPEDYNNWQSLMFGGPTVEAAKRRKHKLTSADYVKVGKWLDKRLKKRDVWVVLMPAEQFTSAIVRGLEHNEDWQLVFFNNKQKLFVDISKPQGRALFDGVVNGKTIYPDQFSGKLVQSHYLSFFTEGKTAKQKGFALAVEALNLNPSPVAMQELRQFARFTYLAPRVYQICQNYLKEFTENKHSYVKEHGYRHRLVAAILASVHLERVANKQNKPDLAQSYAAERRKLNQEMLKIDKGKKW